MDVLLAHTMSSSSVSYRVTLGVSHSPDVSSPSPRPPGSRSSEGREAVASVAVRSLSTVNSSKKHLMLSAIPAELLSESEANSVGDFFRREIFVKKKLPDPCGGRIQAVVEGRLGVDQYCFVVDNAPCTVVLIDRVTHGRGVIESSSAQRHNESVY